MTIVHALGWYFPDSLGGTEIYVEGLCRWLQRAGYDVLVAAPDARASVERTYTHNGVQVYRYPIPATLTREEAQGLVPVRGAERFHAWLQGTQADILHVHGLVSGLGLDELRAAGEAGMRLVLTNHLPSLGFICRRGTLLRWGRRPCDGVTRPRTCAACMLQSRGLRRPLADVVAALPAGLGRAMGTLPGRVGTGLGLRASIARDRERQRELIELVDAFVVLNDEAARIVRRNDLPAGRLVVNRLGVSLPGLLRKAGPSEQPTRTPIEIGFVGRFHAVKGADVLVRAVRRLPPEVPLHVELRGPVSGPDDERCLQQLKALAGPEHRLTFGPALAPAEIGAALGRYDVLCCPSVWFENGPTIALEAQAVGTPVIGSRLGALPEIIADGENGRLFEPGDVGGLARILNELAREPAMVDRWRTALPPPRTMDAIAADYVRLYSSLIEPAVVQG
ncbi:MAG: glycosyltransferase [Acidobacteriota bacterium]|nr:glycosyltransferase [Acidobacteriota bacterium]